jgi:tetratricopeptide (TPR) repeat protein
MFSRARGEQRWRPAPVLILALLTTVTSGCSIRKLAVNTLADALAGSSSSTFATDEDPELVRDALPFALKTIETLLGEVPENTDLLLSACQGFVLYSAGFVELAADRLEATSYRQAKHQHERALKLYLRARGYCFRALDLTFPGASQALVRGTEGALDGARAEHVKLLYWTAAAWGSSIAAGLDRPELVADLPAVRTLIERALDLDPGYDRGALHEAMMLLEFAQIDSGVGSLDDAREHSERALELSRGTRASTYVAWAAAVSVREQDREEFERLLELALAIDPDGDPEARLANVIQQDRARWLLDQADELFL